MKIVFIQKDRNSGSIIILTLWTMFFLASLSVAIGAYVSSASRIAGEIKKRTAGYFLAKAGIEKTIFVVMTDSNAWDSLSERWSSSKDDFRNVSLGNGSYSIGYKVVSDGGQVSTNYGLIDEDRKINVNKASQALLKAVFETIGELDSMAAADLAACVVDWRDADDTMLTGGAESSYYLALSEPYSCRNGDLQSLHELLLVKGMNQLVFDKIRPYLTVYGAGKVNINTADLPVLACVATASGGGDKATCWSLAGKMVSFRKAGLVFTEPGIGALIGQLNSFVEMTVAEKAVFLRMVGAIAIRSGCFGGNAWGRAAASGGDNRQIAFVFDKQSGVKLYWHEF